MWELKTSEEAVKEFSSSLSMGLLGPEAGKRLSQEGMNKLEEKKKEPLILTFLKQFNDPMIYILIFAAVISLTVGLIQHSEDWIDSIIIFVVILINAVIGTWQEIKANQAMDALKKLSSPDAIVKRDGKIQTIKAENLVRGDIVLLEEGNVVPADLRLIKTANLKIDESSLTGESMPVEKNADLVFSSSVGLGDRLNLAYSSTVCTYGRGEGIVVGTGMQTEIGRIATLLTSEKEEMTPLQKRLAELSKVLGFVTIGIVIVMLGIALIRQDWSLTGTEIWDDIIQSFLLAISLAVAAVPEGLTAVVTIVLSMGVQRMAEAHTIVRKLPSVETLGAVSVVCSDKTGTLTQNKMTVMEVYSDGVLLPFSQAGTEQIRFLASGFSLCSNAGVDQGVFGDPTEIALVEMANKLGLHKAQLEEDMKRVDEYPFDSVRKMMSTKHVLKDGTNIIFTKGALDSILKHTDYIREGERVRPITEEDVEKINGAAGKMSATALRTLALAYKESSELTEEKLIFVGLVGMQDPCRAEAKPAVALLKSASIRTIMITGDHKDTAFAIGKELGIVKNKEECLSGSDIDNMSFSQLQEEVKGHSVFARVSPDNKVAIVKALKANGEITAMTGDGVNDAPSLKAADIGIAMGQTGTDVAKEAADLVLSDDNFASIEKAVEEGRNIYSNVKKAIIFLLGTNIAEVLTIFLTTSVLGLPSPLISIHLLWINLITDSLPALALGVDKKDPKIMEQKPRKADESLFAGTVWQLTVYSLLFTLITLAGYLYFPLKNTGCSLFDLNAIQAYFAIADANGVLINLEEAQSTAFTILALSELFYMFGMTDVKRPLYHVFKDKNWWLFISFFLGAALQVLVTEVPGVSSFFHTYQLSLEEWGFIILVALAPLYLHELIVLGQFIYNKAAGKKAKKAH